MLQTIGTVGSIAGLLMLAADPRVGTIVICTSLLIFAAGRMAAR